MIAPLDRAAFFSAVRKAPFDGRLSQSQVDGLNRIIDAFYAHALILDRRHLAYILATSFHETGRRMQPVREAYGTSTADTKSRLEKAWKAGKLSWVKTPYWRDGWFGRGDVQLTHEANYTGAMRDAVRATFGVDIHADPDLVLRGDVSAFVLIEGVTRGVSKRPDFTAYALEDFLTASKTDYENARKTVNPGEKDSYAPIAGYAKAFETALVAGGLPYLTAPGEAVAPEPALPIPPATPPITASNSPPKPPNSPPSAQPALTGGLSSAPSPAPAPAGGLLSRIAARLRAAYPAKG